MPGGSKRKDHHRIWMLFGKYGIRSMTMDALAEEMGISKRTIYERFKDKDTLLLEVITYYKQQTAEEAHKIIDQSDNAIEAMFRIMRDHHQSDRTDESRLFP